LGEVEDLPGRQILTGYNSVRVFVDEGKKVC